MDRYITHELIPPFLFGVGAFTAIAASIDALFDLIRKVVNSGLPLPLAVEIFILKLPALIVLAFPMSTLLATLMTYSRLSSDSELVALRSCGVSLKRIVAPALIFSLFITGFTFTVNELIAPAASYRAGVTLERALKKEKPAFRERNILYQQFDKFKDDNNRWQEALERLFYAREFDGERMKGLTILDLTQDGLDQIVSARSATWNPGENSWDFFDGTIYAVSADGSFRNIVKFKKQQLLIPRTPLDLASRGRDYGEMNIVQASQYLNVLKQGGSERKIRKLRVRIQQKYAIPFVCVVFGLVGAVLGAQPRRTSRTASFGISVIVIFGYYLVNFIASSIGEAGVIAPFMAAWLPTILGLVTGGLLLMRVSR
ncbi:MAG: YjgP/YjgQ family permease [Cyanothece sp. SIO1E1]|nr:YjgP/YjgQ family permease [Cyanothece sp. SIO1E1]